LVGVDIFLDWQGGSADLLGETLGRLGGGEGLKLLIISNRGVKVWPGGLPETFCTDHWRCRYVAEEKGRPITHAQIIALLQRVADAGFDFIKTENLCTFDGQPGYSGRGQ
jgi:isocitrate dehydrogenase